jgi:hypothetical protein
MKCIRTVAARAVNPLFSRADKIKAEAAGEQYDSLEFLDLPVGQVVDSPDAWKLCVLGKAIPEDEDCRKKVMAYLTAPKRQAIVDDIKLLREAAKTNSLGDKDKRMLAMMEKAYAVDLGLVPSPLDVPIKPEPLIPQIGDPFPKVEEDSDHD